MKKESWGEKVQQLENKWSKVLQKNDEAQKRISDQTAVWKQDTNSWKKDEPMKDKKEAERKKLNKEVQMSQRKRKVVDEVDRVVGCIFLFQQTSLIHPSFLHQY